MQSLLQSVLSTYGELPPFPYSLDMLPVQGMGSPAQSVYDAQGKLQRTLVILDGIRKLPAGAPASILQRIENIRFHTINGLVLIDGALRIGRVKAKDPHIEIPGLLEAIDNQILETHKSKPAWEAWMNELKGQAEVEAGLVPSGPQKLRQVQGGASRTVEIKFAGTDNLTSQLVEQKSVADWLVYAGLAGAFMLLVRMWRK